MFAQVCPPIGFAHRGARAHAPENTLEAFTLAARLGANGLESDVWLTADDVAVLDHDGIVKTSFRKRAISEVKRAQLPAHIPALAELYEAVGTEFELSLDVKDPRAFDATVAAAREAGFGAVEKLWLCDPNWNRLAALRRKFDGVRLVDSTRLRHLSEGPERRMASLRDAGIDCINMHHTDWNSGLITLAHRFELFAFGWDAQFDRVVQGLVKSGIDGLYSDDVEMMTSNISKCTNSGD